MKRAASEARSSASSVLSWAAAVGMMIQHAEQQSYRTAVIWSIPRWKAFVVAWQDAAAPLATLEPAGRIDVSEMGIDEIAAWAWSKPGALVDAALESISTRTSMGLGEVVAVFEVLQGAHLIFPNGAVHRRVLDLLRVSEDLKFTRGVADLADANFRVSSARDAAERARAKAVAKGQGDGA